METTALTALLALGAAVCFAVGSVAQHGAASEVPEGRASGLALLVKLARDRTWWAGVGGDATGYGLQVVALLVGPLMLVQPLIVSALVFALPIGARWQHRRVSKSNIGWALALSVGLAVFLVVGNPAPGVDHASGRSWLVVGGIVVLGVGGCAVAAAWTRGRARAALLALMSGTCFGLAAALTKSVIDTLVSDPLGALADGETYGLIIAGSLGFYFEQAAYQAGSLAASLPTMTLAEPVIAAAVGIAILDEHLRADGPERVLLAIAGIVTVVATIALSQSAAHGSVT